MTGLLIGFLLNCVFIGFSCAVALLYINVKSDLEITTHLLFKLNKVRVNNYTINCLVIQLPSRFVTVIATRKRLKFTLVTPVPI